MSIAENVQKFRKLAGVSQRGLADACGVSQQLISQIERGENSSTKYLAAVARALGKNLADFDPTITDVTAVDDFAEKYARLSERDRMIVQSLIDRLESDRAAADQSEPSPAHGQEP